MRWPAHPGRPDVFTAWMDPSVVTESDPLSVDPALDPFDPAHGPPFSAEFQRRYRAAQRARNERITDWALARLAALSRTRALDQLFHTPRTWADLCMIDPTIEPSERSPNRCYRGDARAILTALATPDKQLHQLSADHYFTDPPTARDDLADLIAAWLTAH